MYKTEHIQRIARQTRLPQHTVNDVLTASHRLIEETLREGKAVTFPGFGTFYPSERQAGTVRHMRTGAWIEVPARKVAAFRVGEVLKRAVNGQRRTTPRQQA